MLLLLLLVLVIAIYGSNELEMDESRYRAS